MQFHANHREKANKQKQTHFLLSALHTIQWKPLQINCNCTWSKFHILQKIVMGTASDWATIFIITPVTVAGRHQVGGMGNWNHDRGKGSPLAWENVKTKSQDEVTQPMVESKPIETFWNRRGNASSTTKQDLSFTAAASDTYRFASEGLIKYAEAFISQRDTRSMGSNGRGPQRAGRGQQSIYQCRPFPWGAV